MERKIEINYDIENGKSFFVQLNLDDLEPFDEWVQKYWVPGLQMLHFKLKREANSGQGT